VSPTEVSPTDSAHAKESHSLEVPHPAETALDAVQDAAEVWGAEWHRLGRAGQLELPVSAGLRYGMLAGELSCSDQGQTSTLTFAVEQSAYRVHLPALSVIAVGATGAVVMSISPQFPRLIALVPVGFIVMLCSWFLVLSRLEHRGPSEFLELVREIADHPIDDEDLEAEEAVGDDTGDGDTDDESTADTTDPDDLATSGDGG